MMGQGMVKPAPSVPSLERLGFDGEHWERDLEAGSCRRCNMVHAEGKSRLAGVTYRRRRTIILDGTGRL